MPDHLSASQRILHLASNYRWTGVAEPATSLARYQLAQGAHVTMGAVWGRSFEERLRVLGIPRAEELDLRRLYNPLSIWSQLKRLREYILRERVQIVHSHLLHDHWLAALALRPLPPGRRPILVRTVHRYEQMRRDPWHNWLFSKATDLIITVSTEQRRLIESAYPSAVPQIEVIYGGVDPERFRSDSPGAAAVRADMGERPGAVVAGIVAHLGYNRGHEWLLRAAPPVLEALPQAVIWIVGQGEIKRFLRTELRHPRYQNRVVLAGYRRDDLPETYAALDVGLLLGLGSEGSARAALECMASGRPVIAVAKGALLDTVTDGVDGHLVQENDTETLTRVLTELLGDEERRKRMGEAARRTIMTRFTEQIRGERTERAYRDAVGKRGLTGSFSSGETDLG